MKKLLSIVLAMAMVLALGVTAFAESVTVEDGNLTTGSWNKNDIEVSASYTAAGEAQVTHVYDVDIVWTVTGGSKNEGTITYTWSPDQQKYTAGDAAGASTTDPKVEITVTNNSDMVVYAKAEYADAGTGANTSAATQSVEVPTGVTVTDGNYAGATFSTENISKNITLSITVGDWTELTSNPKTIGTVTITLSKTAF